MRELKPKTIGCRFHQSGCCESTGDQCLFVIPSELSCYNKFYEGPAAYEKDICNDVSEIGEELFKGLTVDEAVNLFYEKTENYSRNDYDFIVTTFEKYVEGLLENK